MHIAPSTTFYVHSSGVYQNKSHVNNNTIFALFPSCALHATIATFLPLAVVESILEGYGPLMNKPHNYCVL
jgi:hypothetical protein